MRVVPCMLMLAVLCAGGSGCALFKKNANNPPSVPAGPGVAPPKFPGVQDPLLNSNIPSLPTFPPAAPSPSNPPVTPTAHGTSTLAGTVLDAHYRPVGNAFVRWVSLEERDGTAPIDVAANASGHFIIQGLKAGIAYKLIARTKLGDKMLAGTVLTTAPNTRVAIMIREDLVNASTPPLPGAPTYPGAAQGVGKGAEWNGTPKPAPRPIASEPLPGSAQPQEPNLPATMTLPTPPSNNPPAPAPAFMPGIAGTPSKDRLPMLTIPKGPRPEPKSPPVPAGPGDARLDTGPTRVPSCVLVGNRLENLALKDSKGQTWEYRKQGHGRLVLLDFWGTHCFFCRESMPALDRLQQQYGSRGLDVIGIALEPGKDERKESEAVNKFCTSMQLSYRQLMGHVGAFDAGKNFNIQGVPTLILLSEQGDILLHHVGRPDAAMLSSLERTIQHRLNHRPF